MQVPKMKQPDIASNTSQTILIVEDDLFQRNVLKSLLENKSSYVIKEAEDSNEALETLKNTPSISLIILDLNLPGLHGLECLALIKEKYPSIPTIVLTSSENVDDVVNAMKNGAADFLNKPPEPKRLLVSIENALKFNALSKEVLRLQRKDSGSILFSDIIGYDNGLATVVNRAQKAARSDIPVLITGETGVGKELFAGAIHGESERAGNPFITVNCGAIPKELVESTLFGHEKGAFTGAVSKTAGKFREAQGGTIFLDEVGELPLDAQVKLLRVLQQKEVEPVGSAKTVPIDVRVISATNRSLPDEIQTGNFREDLFFRLEGLPLELPPLRERKSDLPHLVSFFIQQFSSLENLPQKAISEDAMNYLVKRDWSGNIRELKNTLHRAIVLSEDDVITKEDFVSISSVEETSMFNEAAIADDNHYITVIHTDGSISPLSIIEEKAFRIVMDYYQNNITQAAESLDIAKSTFYRKWKGFSN